MKILLYFENSEQIKKSGIGKALEHQKKALELAGVDYTLNPDDDYDILHINTMFLNSAHIISQAKKKGARIIYHAHSTAEDFRNSFVFSNTVSKVVKQYFINLYERADYIITPTAYSKKLLEDYGIKVPIAAISNGVDINKFSVNDESEKIFREHFNLAPDKKVVISSGLWIKRKGILDFIEIARKLPDIEFIWFGDAHIYSIPIEIRKAITKDHPPNVHFPGYMQGKVYEGAFSAADIFLFPSYEETEGIVVLEAMSCSKVCLLRDIPVYDAWLTDGENCFKSKNNDNFVEKIKMIISEDYSDIGRNARKTVESRSLENIGLKLKNVYDELLKDKTLSRIEEYEDKNKKPGKLNIGIFSDTYPPDVNGVSVSVFTLREQLLKMGHNVYVITPTLDTKIIGTVFENGILRIPAIKINQLYGYRLARPYSIRAMSYIKKMKLDIVHNNSEFTMRILANIVSNAFDIPYVYTYHTLFEDYTHYVNKGHFEDVSKKAVSWYTKHIAEKCDEIIVPSEKTRRILVSYGIQKQMHIIPTGINVEKLNPKNLDENIRKNLIDKYELNGKFCICYVGRLAAEKNVDFLLANVPALKEKIPNLKVIITGYGPSFDELQVQTEALEIQDTVIFTGKQPPSEIQYYYSLGEIFSTASTSETQGLTYIEAMACGIPVIAKFDDCLQNILIDGETGYSFSNGSEFIEAVMNYYNATKEKKLYMKAKALEKAAEFSLDSFGKSVVHVYYQAVINNRRDKSRKRKNKDKKLKLK